jgi:hypothetical protein
MAFEPMDSAGVQARVVTLMITDTFTEQLIDVVGTVPTYAAQSSAFTSVVRSGIRNVRAGGIYVDIQIAAIVLLGMTLVLRFEAGVDTTSVAVQARTMIVEYVNGLAPGVPYVPADALNILRRVPGLIVTGAEIYSPAGTVQPRPLEALRTHLGLVLVNTAGV